MTAFYKKLIGGGDKKQENKAPVDNPEGGNEVLIQIKKIREHLVFLERKVDQLLNNSGSGPRRFDRNSRNNRPHAPGSGPSTGPRRWDSHQNLENKEDRRYMVNKGNRNFPH